MKITSVVDNQIKSEEYSVVLDFYILTNQFLVFLQISSFAFSVCILSKPTATTKMRSIKMLLNTISP